MTSNNTSMKKGSNSYLVSFEGIEGSGKTTQLNFFKEILAKAGHTFSYYREPGGTDFGEKLRSAILESKTAIAPIAEAMLFASSRAQLITEKVIPDLAKDNHVVILDRYIDSSLAYQGIARGLGFDTVLELHSYFPLTLRPDLTFYLKIDLETSLKRQDTRGNEKDYFEKEAHVFYQNLIDGYNQSASKFTRRIKSINAQNTIETVSNDLSDTWVQFLKGN